MDVVTCLPFKFCDECLEFDMKARCAELFPSKSNNVPHMIRSVTIECRNADRCRELYKEMQRMSKTEQNE